MSFSQFKKLYVGIVVVGILLWSVLFFLDTSPDDGVVMNLLWLVLPTIFLGPPAVGLVYLTIVDIGKDITTAQKNAYLAAIREAKKDDD